MELKAAMATSDHLDAEAAFEYEVRARDGKRESKEGLGYVQGAMSKGRMESREHKQGGRCKVTAKRNGKARSGTAVLNIR